MWHTFGNYHFYFFKDNVMGGVDFSILIFKCMMDMVSIRNERVISFLTSPNNQNSRLL